MDAKNGANPKHYRPKPEFDSFVALKKRNSPVFSGLVAPNHKIPIV